MAQRAYTLLEMLIVVILVGILAAMALPGFGRATERAHQRKAWDMLQTIYASEQVFFSVNDRYSDTWNDPNPANPDLGDYMDFPGTTTTSFTLSATGPPSPTFLATAKRQGTGGLCSGLTMTINQTRGKGGTGWLNCPTGGLE